MQTTKKYHYTKLREQAERIDMMIRNRAQKLAQEAGLNGIQLHNALVDLHYGHPWPKIDYKKAKKAQFLFTQRYFIGYHLVDRLYKKGKTYFKTPDTY